MPFWKSYINKVYCVRKYPILMCLEVKRGQISSFIFLTPERHSFLGGNDV